MKSRYVALARLGERDSAFDFLKVGDVQAPVDQDPASEQDPYAFSGTDGASALFAAEIKGKGRGKGRDKDKGTPAPEEPEVQPEEPEVTPEDPDTGFDSGAPQYAIDAVSSGKSWSVTTINFAFMESLPSYAYQSGFSAFTESQRAGTLEAFEMISAFTGLEFVQTDVAQSHIALGNANFGAGAGGYGWYPSGDAQNSISGDVFLNNYYSQTQTATPGKYGFMILMHEIGHAMGLEHPHDGDLLPASEDTRQYTVESYNHHAGMGTVEPHSYMTYDIAALQDIYGANLGWASGDDVYDYSDARNLIETIWDAGGNDTITAAGSVAGAVIDLTEGGFSSIGERGSKLAAENIGIAYGTVIENAEGSSHADRLVGNAADNRLAGLAGNDILLGGGGSDQFIFGAGSGVDIVEDFQNGVDRLVMTGAGLSFGALALADEGDGTRVAFGADSVLLRGVSVSDLDAGDFLFG